MENMDSDSDGYEADQEEVLDVARLNETIDSNMESLANITKILAETIGMSDGVEYSADSEIGKQFAAVNVKILEIAEEAANMAYLMVYVKQEINRH